MKDTDIESLPAKQRAAVEALMTEPSVAKAAQACGVTERTLYRWMNEEAFAREYAAARRHVFGQAVALTQRYASLAAQMLATIMVDKTAPAVARVNAARTILDFGREGVEIDDLSQRLRDLESNISEMDQDRKEAA